MKDEPERETWRQKSEYRERKEEKRDGARKKN